MSRTDDPATAKALDERRRNRIGLIVIILALICTAFAWTGLSVKEVLRALHF